MKKILLLCIFTVIDCNGRSKETPLKQDAAPLVRAIEPPPGNTRSMPPHDIHREGVGPYRLGSSLHDALSILPRGPRMELWPIEGVASYRLVRVEGDALMLGSGRQGNVQFISVLDPRIAQTGKGVGVGASIGELKNELGAVQLSQAARDPRLVVFESLPGTHFVVDRDRVVATLTTPVTLGSRPRINACFENVSLPKGKMDVRKITGEAAGSPVVKGCLGDEPIWVVTGKNKVFVVGQESERYRKIAQAQMGGISFAAPIDVNGDGRDEIAFVKVKSGVTQKSVDVAISAVDNKTLSSIASSRVVTIDKKSTELVGAALADVDLLTELVIQDERVVAHVIYVHRKNQRLREVIPLFSTPIRVKERARPSESTKMN